MTRTRQHLAAAAAATLMICALGHAGAAHAQAQPAADTPVPPEFKDSYDAYLAAKAKAHGGTRHTVNDVPDWTGIWTRGPGGLKFDPAQPGDPLQGHVTAQLTPAAQAAYDKKVADARNGIEWDQLSNCLPAGFPRWLTEPFLKEFIVTPNETWWINEQESEARRIYTDNRGHVPDDEAFPLWEGDSIGFWDGDTLVVHTIRVKPGQYQRAQPDYSDQTSTLERIHKTGPDTIEDDITVWDPKGLAKPWSTVQTYVRVKTDHIRIDMWSCEENNNVVKTDSGTSTFILPGEKGYKDPNTLLQAPPAGAPAPAPAK